MEPARLGHRHLWKRFNSKQTLLGHTGWATSAAFSADGKRIISGSGWPIGEVKVWNLEALLPAPLKRRSLVLRSS